MTLVVEVKKIFLQYLFMLTLLCLPALLFAENDVPTEYMKLKNPLVLSESRTKYFAKQFLTKCARCHGELGNGTTEAEMEVRPADLTDTNFMKSRTDGELFYQIEKGGEERSAMPAFGEDSDHGWSDQKIWGMVAYLRQLALSKSN